MSTCDRRGFVTLSVASFVNLSLSLPAIAKAARLANQMNGFEGSPPKLNWDAFLAKIDRAARGQYRRSWDQAAYVQRVEAVARSLNHMDSELQRSLSSSRPTMGALPSFVDLEQRMTFQIMLITFQRGQIIPLHDHPRMTGVMTCASGLVDVSRFHLVAIDRSGRSCTLGSEGVVRLGAGAVSSLTQNAHNIHGLRAHSFCQVIDIFTPPYDPGRIRDSKWFRIEGPVRAGAEVAASVLPSI